MSVPTDPPETSSQEGQKGRHTYVILDRLIRRFRDNRVGFLKTHKWLIALFLIALACDALSTVHFMHERPGDGELHPVVNIASELLGPLVGPLVGFAGKAIAGLCIGIYCRRWARLILGVAIVIALWAACYNLWGVGFYYPNLLRLIPW